MFFQKINRLTDQLKQTQQLENSKPVRIFFNLSLLNVQHLLYTILLFGYQDHCRKLNKKT